MEISKANNQINYKIKSNKLLIKTTVVLRDNHLL